MAAARRALLEVDGDVTYIRVSNGYLTILKEEFLNNTGCTLKYNDGRVHGILSRTIIRCVRFATVTITLGRSQRMTGCNKVNNGGNK